MAVDTNVYGIKYEVDLDELKSSTAEASRQIKMANAKFNEASSGMENWAEDVDGLNAKLTQLNTILQAEKTKLAQSKKSYNDLSDSITENAQRIDELKENDTIVISNSISDHGRILTILSDAGVITLDSSVTSVDATTQDIIDNPLNLKFVEIKPELLASAYENEEGALVAINGNYALQAGLNPVEDAVLLEDVSSDNPYVNVVACKSKDKDSDKIKALVEVLKSDAIKDFINEKYQGSVIVIE